MLRHSLAAACLALLFGAPAAFAAEGEVEPIERDWSFDGVFGSFDRAAAQRGLQVYQTVCQSCHGLSFIAFRNLAELGYDEAEVAAFAAMYQVQDGPDDTGEMFDRDGRPSDHFPRPFPNEEAARAANGGAYPPDLSLLVKAREHGANHLYSVLVGYEEAPPDVTVPEGMYYNRYFTGHMIAMPPPLSEGVVSYEDGTEATVSQMASDVSQFLAFASEPKLEVRKRTGVKGMLFLFVTAGIFYAYKRKVWAAVH